MAWRQNLAGSEQHLTRAAAAARTRTQRPGKHLAVRASELVVEPDFQILRRYRRPLLLRLEHTHRPTLEDYVHRATRLGSSRSLNMRIGIRPTAEQGSASFAGKRALFSVRIGIDGEIPWSLPARTRHQSCLDCLFALSAFQSLHLPMLGRRTGKARMSSRDTRTRRRA